MALVFAALVGCGSPESAPAPAKPSALQQMRDALRVGRWGAAHEHARQALVAHPTDPDVITDAAKAAAMTGHKREAAQLLVDAAEITNYTPPTRVDFAFQALIDVGEIYGAIDLLERALAAHPDNVQHRRLLVGILAEAQRTELIGPHYEKVIRQRGFDFPFLVAFTESSTRRLAADTSDLIIERNPDDHRIRLGKARFLIDYRDAAESRRVLREVLQKHPQFTPAHVLLGQVLVSEQKFDELKKWYENLPDDADRHVDFWLTLGDWAVDRQQYPPAARAFWQATQIDPNDITAWTRLAHTVRTMRALEIPEGDDVSDEQLQDIDRRIADLLEARERLFAFEKSNRTSQRLAIETAKMLSQLGRHWEAEAWAAAATTLTEDPSDEVETVRQSIVAKLREDPDWLSAKNRPALALNLSSLPTPKITSEPARSRSTAVVPPVATHDHVRLTQQANRWGLEGVGAGNNPSDARLGPLIRSTGVGGATIDYDLDGWPDALIVGAGGTMLKMDSIPNALVRNLGDRFVSVTEQASVGDRSYGQGVAVGDFNEDGFPDLFYANLGKNRLLRNNGDGTFTDCTELLQDGGAMNWSTCGAFMDMNEDGIADLITTNYCEAVANLDRACPRDDGVLGPCHPLKFPADDDQFFSGAGDGRMIDVTDAWTPDVSPGRGLGILAGALQLDEFGLLIVNDMSTNEYYTRIEGPELKFSESAAARGVAVDARTLEQASMGIASGDFDGDGDLDIYVTGFGKEYNILYEQVAPGLWKDETARVGLVEPSLMVVGFGTEAIDMDNDGIDELAVTNGHIGDFETDEITYEQPFQLYRRGGTGSFDLLEDDHWGEYFEKHHVGRALWTIDANRDGRTDIMITHTSEQVGLLINDSKTNNHSIAIKLVGRNCSRDAIGAVVTFQANGRKRTMWCLAGDGYMCTNEQLMRAGIGDATQIDNVTVTWQDGSTDEVGSLEANAEYVIVQGQGEAFQTDQIQP